MIKEFSGETRWASNFTDVEIEFEGIVYSSTEHAYMSAKSKSIVWKEFCADPKNKPGKIKRKSYEDGFELDPNWTDERRLEVMREVCVKKFNQEPFKTMLIATGTQNIQEGNTWGDEFFGINLKTGIGENYLGRIIMDIRKEI